MKSFNNGEKVLTRPECLVFKGYFYGLGVVLGLYAMPTCLKPMKAATDTGLLDVSVKFIRLEEKCIFVKARF